MTKGSQPSDGEHLRLSSEDRAKLLTSHPETHVFIKPCIGSQELLKGIERYCLWIEEKDAEYAASFPFINSRLELTKGVRLKSRKASTRSAASRPYEFEENRHVEAKFTLVAPVISSGERKFLPVNILSGGEVVNNSAFMLPNAELWDMAILSSSLHRCWLNAVAGKLEDRYRYSNTLVWNTFPMPELSDDDKQALSETAQKILNARHYHPDLTLGDMYNTENMGAQLLAAHKENDRVLEKIFRDKPFKNDEDRLAHLFERYAEMTQGEQ